MTYAHLLKSKAGDGYNVYRQDLPFTRAEAEALAAAWHGARLVDASAYVADPYVYVSPADPEYVGDCGVCGMEHPYTFEGDCRDDGNRLSRGFSQPGLFPVALFEIPEIV